MRNYDYEVAVCDDVRRFIEDELDLTEWKGNREGLSEYLNDTLWVDDSVTGNASGSYTFSTWKAEEHIAHNLDLLAEALSEFGCGTDYLLEHGAEAADVTIRCYLLSGCIESVLDEFDEELEEV